MTGSISRQKERITPFSRRGTGKKGSDRRADRVSPMSRKDFTRYRFCHMGAEVTTDIPACWFRFGYRIKADSTKIGEKAPIRSKLTNGQVIAKPGIGSCPAFPR